MSPDFKRWVEEAKSPGLAEVVMQRGGLRLKRQGHRLTGPCPRCGGDDRFYVNTDLGLFNCNGCDCGKGKKGAVDFVEFLDGCSFLQACETLTGRAPPKDQPNGHDKKSGKDKPVVVEVYDYRDENGELYFQIQRVQYAGPDGNWITKGDKPRKTFWQRRPDIRPGLWIPNVEGCRALPYRLPELLVALKAGRIVFNVEGERKVNVLHDIGLAATCNSQGAEKWTGEHSAFFPAGSISVLLADADEAGRKHRDVVGASLKKAGVDVRVLELPGLKAKQDIVDWVDAGGTAKQLIELARDAKPWVETSHEAPAPAPGTPPPEEDDDRPTIELVAGDEPRIVDEIEAAVILADLGLYQRGGLIVRVEDRKFLGFEEKEIVSTAIAEQCEHTLLEDAAGAAHFLKYNERAKTWKTASPPMLHINIWRGRGGRSRLPILSGPIGSPLILPTGRIIEKPGFDPATGFFFNPLGITFPPVPRDPTKQDARDAIALLDQLLVGFPFAEDGGVSRSVATAGLLTAVMRRAVGLAPMFAISAPSFGSGKSYLVNVFCALSTGRAAPVVTPGKTEKEFETRLDALLLEGISFIAIDNVEPSQLGVQSLATTLSEREKKCRVLSESKMPVCSTDVFISCTGNNLEIVEDLRRRTLLCELDPEDERPWTRHFESDPLSMLSRERGRFVIACLTIVRAYMVSCEAVEATPYANYEIWSRMIREPLLWLGLADPVASQVTTEDLDPFRDKFLAIATEWDSAFGDELKTIPQIRAEAEARYSEEPHKLKNPGLHNVLVSVAEIKGIIDGGRLSKWLKRARGRRVDHYRFEMITNSISNEKKTRNHYWKLKGARSV
jgi:hypothetical protein